MAKDATVLAIPVPSNPAAPEVFRVTKPSAEIPTLVVSSSRARFTALKNCMLSRFSDRGAVGIIVLISRAITARLDWSLR